MHLKALSLNILNKMAIFKNVEHESSFNLIKYQIELIKIYKLY